MEQRARRSERSTLRGQDPAIDWDNLASLNPYPGQAIKDDQLLAGRDQLLTDLTALATGPEVGSIRISGEKRVGKSSLVRSLETRLNRLPGSPLVVVYVDINKLGVEDEEPERALSGVMRAIIRRLRRSDAALANLTGVDGDDCGADGFSEFLEAAISELSGRRILVILDEFDELPNAAFERGGAGDAFFRVLKAFSSRRRLWVRIGRGRAAGAGSQSPTRSVNASVSARSLHRPRSARRLRRACGAPGARIPGYRRRGNIGTASTNGRPSVLHTPRVSRDSRNGAFAARQSRDDGRGRRRVRCRVAEGTRYSIRPHLV